jgi:hypothetical protein
MALLSQLLSGYLLTHKTKYLSALLTNKNPTNLSQVQEKAPWDLPQVVVNQVRSNYLNCCYCCSVSQAQAIARSATLLLAVRIPRVARFPHSQGQAGRVPRAVLLVGAQLPVLVRLLVGELARFRFEALEWGTQKAPLRVRASAMVSVPLRALGRELPGLGTQKVRR